MKTPFKYALAGFFTSLFLGCPLVLQAQESQPEEVIAPLNTETVNDSETVFQEMELSAVLTEPANTEQIESVLDEETDSQSADQESLSSDLLEETDVSQNESETVSKSETEPDLSSVQSEPVFNYGWQADGSYLSYTNGQPWIGFLNWNSNQYYFKEDGSRAMNETLLIDGKTYCFDETGKVIKGFVADPAVNTNHYYSQFDGHLMDGLKAYDNDLYILNQPAPAPGLLEYNGMTVYSQGDGTIASNELANINGVSYYFDQNGARQQGKIVNLNGQQIYLSNKDGAVVTPQEYQIRILAQDVINMIGTNLRDLFNWEVGAMTYQKDIFTKSREDYALKAFSEHQGNCFAYAAMYYYLVDQLGYQARFINSWVKFYNGNSSGHGWVMIREGDKEYIYDPEAQAELSQGGRYNFFRQDPWNPLFDYVYPDGIEPPQGCAHPYL